MRSKDPVKNIIRIGRFDQNFQAIQSDILKIENNNFNLIESENYVELNNVFPNTKIKIPRGNIHSIILQYREPTRSSTQN